MVSGRALDKTTWLLVVIMTELVRRPLVASIKRFSFFAMLFNLLIGAASADTIATILSAAIVFLKPTSINVLLFALFDILGLLSYFLHKTLYFYYLFGDPEIAGFRTNRIGFAGDFLCNKV